MEKQGVLTRILAITGTMLVWLPILAPIFFSMLLLMRRRIFRFDYLMPAELFPAILPGGVLLVWAARRAHSHRKLIGWSLVLAVALLAGGQVLAVGAGHRLPDSLSAGDSRYRGWRNLAVA